MSTATIMGIKVCYFLINKDYGGMNFCNAFLEELNKRRGGVPIEYSFCVKRNDPHAVAIFDEKGSAWCAGGERAKIIKIAIPEACWEWVVISDYDGLESYYVNFCLAYFKDMNELLKNDHATIEDARAVKAKNDAMKTDYEDLIELEREHDTVGY
eukprot:CAMPEP_0119021628 /NCGR_PEP_ID=MMETSP1176-20130426/26368_1 /TAXON_ID=265551 /ORGANISM="Synedropsis recta cf, Strain CCMP1620" /LENGTH=154 /DNA_ID=CAMNT_0006976275 /DNA_START=504 /DNA_END=968 /DNA_ORIENTATION=-